jgi:desulfoferrodoxin-like iron-binding protein
MANQLGKRFKCEACGSEVLCTKAGEGSVVCCGKEMELQKPKALPSSD